MWGITCRKLVQEMGEMVKPLAVINKNVTYSELVG
jgi:hypothetical protein